MGAKEAIGFVGLGIMGHAMAARLKAAGFPLTVHNRTPSKTGELAAAGAVVADTPAALAARSAIVVTMVSDTPDVETVIAGPSGILEGIRPRSLVVDMSTISPDAEKRLAARLRDKKCDLVDAPVSGGDVGARDGTLAIMAGGEGDSFARAKPLFEVMGKSVIHCGPVGSGQLTKLCNQILVSITMLGVSEALAFARRTGLDPKTMIEAVQGGAAGSWQLQNLGPRILDRDFDPGFMIDLMQKDLRLVLEAGACGGAALPATALVHQLFRSAQSGGDGRAGTQALAKVLERLSSLD